MAKSGAWSQRLRFLTAMGVVAALGGPVGAWASSAGSPSSNVSLPFMNTQEFESCDQACMYKRANENLSLQVGYIIHKTDKIQGLIDAKKGAEAREALGAFCASSTEDLTKCFNRWKVMNTTLLHQARGAMIRNSDSAASLNSDVTPAGAKGAGAPRLGRVVDPSKADDEARRPQVTYVPTFEELQQQMIRESQRVQAMDPADYAQELQSLMREPKEEDFPLFKRIPKNPSNPVAGEDFIVAVYGAGGKLQTDKEAFEAAKALYQKSKPKIDQELAALKGQSVRSRAAFVDGKRKAFVTPASRAKGAAPAVGSDEETFNEARQPLVNMANEVIKKKVQVEAGSFKIQNPNFNPRPMQPAPGKSAGSRSTASGATGTQGGPTLTRSSGGSVDQSAQVQKVGNSAASQSTEVLVPQKQSTKNRKPGDETFSQITSGYAPEGGRLKESDGSASDNATDSTEIDEYMELK